MKLSVRNLDGFVDRTGSGETQPLVQLDRADV
jgi:hypothetical protein